MQVIFAEGVPQREKKETRKNKKTKDGKKREKKRRPAQEPGTGAGIVLVSAAQREEFPCGG